MTYTRRAQVEAPASDETVRCLLYMAGTLLPIERAEPLLTDAIARELGMTSSHWWCSNPLETLNVRLTDAGRMDEAKAVKKRLEDWWEEVGGMRTDSEKIDFDEETPSSCENNLCRIHEVLGDEAMAAWLGPDPPLQYFNYGQAVDISHALIEAGQIEEGRRLAAFASPMAKIDAGPKGHPTVTGNAIMLLALSGDIEGALGYAQQVGPEGFAMFGIDLNLWALDLNLTGLIEDPRWARFMERCEARWLAEVEKYDRLVASGDIVMP